MEAYSVRTS
jgi:Oxysterol-binding protein